MSRYLETSHLKTGPKFRAKKRSPFEGCKNSQPGFFSIPQFVLCPSRMNISFGDSCLWAEFSNWLFELQSSLTANQILIEQLLVGLLCWHWWRRIEPGSRVQIQLLAELFKSIILAKFSGFFGDIWNFERKKNLSGEFSSVSWASNLTKYKAIFLRVRSKKWPSSDQRECNLSSNV